MQGTRCKVKTVVAVFLAFFLFPLSSCSPAFADEWSRADTWREATYQSLALIDWAQTRNIGSKPDCLYEHNSILGKHPGSGKINAYFALTGIAHAAIAYALPSEYRVPFQYITIGIEVGAVAHNFSIGISAKF